MFHRVVFHCGVHIVQAPYRTLADVSESVIADLDVSIRTVVNHAVASHACKNILESIILNQHIFTDSTVERLISWENIVQAGIQLNTFLSAALIIFPVATEGAAGHYSILHTCKFKEMRLQVVKKGDILHGYIGSMSNTEANETAWILLAFYILIVQIPGSAINGNIPIAIIAAIRKHFFPKPENNVLVGAALRDNCTLGIKSHIAVQMNGIGNIIISRRNDHFTGRHICSTLPHKFQNKVQHIGDISSILDIQGNLCGICRNFGKNFCFLFGKIGSLYFCLCLIRASICECHLVTAAAEKSSLTLLFF